MKPILPRGLTHRDTVFWLQVLLILTLLGGWALIALTQLP